MAAMLTSYTSPAYEDWEISTIAFNSENECLIIINDELSRQTNRIKFHSVGCVSIIYNLVSHIHHNNRRNNKNQNIHKSILTFLVS